MNVSRIAAATGALAATVALVGNALAADFGAPPPRALPPPIVYAPPAAIYEPAPIVYAPPMDYHCMRWTDICNGRWGFGSPRFARCMWRHGC